MNLPKMQRVSKKTPCPVCGKPDWCLVAQDGSAAICQRVQEGSVKRCGDAGWLHILSDNFHKGLKRKYYYARIPIDFGKEKDFSNLARLFQLQLSEERLCQLCSQLNLSAESLKRLNIGWDGEAFTFPMSKGTGKIIGIRRRFPNGTKVSVKASTTGLFIPSQKTSCELVLICEGPTDTAAALDLGFGAIGRPNCNSLIRETISAVKGYREIVIFGDNDAAGRAGAERLADYLTIRCPKVKVIYPPEGIKDLREWLRKGLTAAYLKQVINSTEIAKVQIKLKD